MDPKRNSINSPSCFKIRLRSLINIKNIIVPRCDNAAQFFPLQGFCFFWEFVNNTKIVYNFLYNIGQRFAPY